ncbi:MAG: winged helix-turn-helix domain-containing protein [Candidatus Obscuribacter sp.]|nr:winged helix-turn-helix domain-containing protein [Candidatus Obscuribacter sp.]
MLARVWNFEAQATADGLRTAISRIRKVVDDENVSDSIIENVPKLGYRLRS